MKSRTSLRMAIIMVAAVTLLFLAMFSFDDGGITGAATYGGAGSCGQTVTTTSTLISNVGTCTGNGLRIAASNIILDCMGYNITGNGASNRYGIYLDGVENVTIRNCGINNFYYGIESDYSNNSLIENNHVFQYSRYGIILDVYNNNNILRGNNVTDSTSYGISIDAGFNYYNTLYNNRAYNNPGSGFDLRNSDDMNVSNNYGYNNDGAGMQVGSYSENNSFFNNIMFNNTESGFTVISNQNNFTNNTAYGNQENGFLISGGDNCLLVNNTAYDNTEDGFLLFDVSGNTLINNIAYNNTRDGFYVFNSDDDNLTNIVSYNNRNGVKIHKDLMGGPGSNVSVKNSLIYNNTAHGVFINNTANEFVINNTIRSNAGSGIYISGSSVINVTLNTVLNHSYSIDLADADDNYIYNNYFEDLPRADSASTGNAWNITKTPGLNIYNGSYLGGNYWGNYNGTDLDGDGLGDTELPWAGLTNLIINGGDYHPLTDSYVKDIQCEFESSGTFVACDNAGFFENITRVRANCTALNGAIANATFNLTNIFDAHTFFSDATTTYTGGYYVLDNSDVQILDSGDWELNVYCTNTSGYRRRGLAPFNIPFGNISNAVLLTQSLYVEQNDSFNISSQVGCTGGECVNITATLDPQVINPPTGYPYLTNDVIVTDCDQGWTPTAAVEFLNGTSKAMSVLNNSVGPLDSIFDVDIRADGNFVLADAGWGSGIGSILFMNATTNSVTILNASNLGAPFVAVTSIAIDSNGDYISGGFAIGWNPAVFKTNATDYSTTVIANSGFPDLGNPVTGMDVDSNGDYIAVGGDVSFGGPSYVVLVNATSGSVTSINNTNTGAQFQSLTGIKIDENGDYIVSDADLNFGNPGVYLVNHTTHESILINDSNSGAPWGVWSSLDGVTIDSNGDYIVSDSSNQAIYRINKTSCAITTLNSTGPPFINVGFVGGGPFGLEAIILGGGAATTPSITINSLAVEAPGLNASVVCTANVTAEYSNVAGVEFNITYPDNSVVVLGNGTRNGTIWTSSEFTVSQSGSYTCSVLATNNASDTDFNFTLFTSGDSGVIPMNSGNPFYTTNQNPVYAANQSCLDSLLPGQTCQQNWTVFATGETGTSWEFYVIYTGSYLETNKITVTIGTEPVAPPAPPGGSGGSGGGSRAQCMNNRDDDGDGLIDFPNDPGCDYRTDDNETDNLCTQSWSCNPWEECVDGIQTRVCFDAARCYERLSFGEFHGVVEVVKPVEEKDCKIPATCYDGIQNGNEEGIDCGGDCPDCLRVMDVEEPMPFGLYFLNRELVDYPSYEQLDLMEKKGLEDRRVTGFMDIYYKYYLPLPTALGARLAKLHPLVRVIVFIASFLFVLELLYLMSKRS